MNSLDTLLDKRGLPANLDAERFVLGSALLNDRTYPQLAEVLAVDDFSLEKHRRIFARMADLYGRGERVDRVTLANELVKQGQLESVDGLSYLVSLDDGLPEITNVESYVGIVKEKSTLRRAIFRAAALIEGCLSGGDSGAVLDEAMRALAALSDERAGEGGLRSAREIIEAYPGGVPAFLEPSRSDPGIQTPWKGLNAILGGLKPAQLVLIAARPMVGKSAALAQIAEYAASSGVGVAIFSLEMGSGEILHRSIVSRASVDFQKFRLGMLDPEERERVQYSLSEISEMPMYLDDRAGSTVASIHASIRRHKAKHNIGLVVVDYLGLLATSGRAENRTQEVSQISRGLKLAAREFNLPFAVAAQLNRSPATENRRPQLSDLRDSGSLEQDADTVMFLHPEAQKTEEYAAGLPLKVEMIVAKQRQGPRGTVRVMFHGKHLKFFEPIPGHG